MNEPDSQIENMFDARLQQGDIAGALNHSIMYADQSQAIAQEAIANLNDASEQIQQLAQQTLDQYPLL